MDEFGVLTERFGLKPQGKSAPMAASRRPTTTSQTSYRSPSNSNSNSSSSSAYVSFLDDQNGLFSGGGPAQHQSQGSTFNLDSIFSGSVGSNHTTSSFSDGFDVFGSGSVNDDIFGSFSSAHKPSNNNNNDLLGDLGWARRKLQDMNLNKKNSSNVNAASSDDLLSGFGFSTTSNNTGKHIQESRSQQSTVSSPMDDPFPVFKSVSNSTLAYGFSDFFEKEEISKRNNSGGAKHGGSSNSSTKLRAPPKPSQVSNGRTPGVSSIDDLEDFARVQKNPPVHGKSSWEDLDFNFITGFRSNSVPKSRVKNVDPVIDEQKANRTGVMPQRPSSGAPGSLKKSPSANTILDDLFSMDGAGSPLVAEFKEIEGESVERRNLRWERFQRTQDRAMQAVKDMNQRVLHIQQEQEERHRISENMDTKIKSWVAGKEGNMRALLSSLQYVLWPDCGWQSVSLTDLITSGSVKKVYYKAVLCTHPDKTQQKGSSLEQKYTAEKVFDILKEAYTKFEKEELS